MTARKRPRPPSIRVERDVALRMLGFERSQVDLDHDPALELRAYDENTGQYFPDANDPKYLVFRTKAEHKAKTSGRKGTQRSTSYGSDAHAAAKLRRLQNQLLDKPKRKLGRRWPKRKLRSRSSFGWTKELKQAKR